MVEQALIARSCEDKTMRPEREARFSSFRDGAVCAYGSRENR